MTITRRPPRTPAPAAPVAPTRRKTSPESFIEEANHPTPAAEPAAPAPAALPEPAVEDPRSAKKTKTKGKSRDKEKSKGKHKAEKIEKAKRKDKEAVLIRFEDEQLAQMDQRAASLGLSRAAWLRMLVSKALRGKKS